MVDSLDEHRANFFSQVYTQNLWDGGESRSGQGSGVFQTRTLIEGLPAMLSRYQIGSLLDVPCGDFNWMKEVDFGSSTYIGGDIVPELIEENQRKYGSDRRQFICIDLVSQALPAADMIFIRDCFIHFSTDLVFQSLNNILSSPIKYICMTHDMQHIRYPNGENVPLERAQDGVNFEYRPIDFEIPPFSFPPPLDVLNEHPNRKDFGGGGEYVMALWEASQIRAALAAGSAGPASQPG